MKIEQLRLKILDKAQADGTTAFTDLELQAFLTETNGNLPMAASIALTELTNDKGRLMRWAKGDTKIDYDVLMSDLIEVAQKFHNQAVSEGYHDN